MQIKPNKWKVAVALIPVYTLFFIIPVLPMIIEVPLFLYGDFFNTAAGNFFLGIGLLVYSFFTVLLFPFTWLFESLGLVKDSSVLPEINPFGLLLLALIYSSLIYLLISVFQKKN